MKPSESTHTRSIRRLLEIEAEAEKQIQDSKNRNDQIIADAKQEADQIIKKAQSKAKREAKKIVDQAVKKAEEEGGQLVVQTSKEVQDIQKVSADHMTLAAEKIVDWVTAKGIDS